MNTVEVRRELADALNLDLVGPSERLGSPIEVLPQSPSRWYLTGFLVPLDAEQSQKVDEDSSDAVDALGVERSSTGTHSSSFRIRTPRQTYASPA